MHECLTPIKCLSVQGSGGRLVFPMKERFERIQAGFSSEAVERPVSRSLENQDAEPQEEPGELLPAPPAADLTVKPPEVIVPKPVRLFLCRKAKRYYDSGGVMGRRYGGERGSKKPDSIPSSIWVNLSKKQKEKAIEDEARKLALEELDERVRRIIEQPCEAFSRCIARQR